MATITDVWTPQTPAGAVAYRTAACLDDGSVAIIRLLEPTDEMLLRAFQNALPERSFERRCFHEMKLERGLDHRQLATLCAGSADEALLVADRRNPATLHHQILGIGRIGRIPRTAEADLAFVVAGHWQALHVGARLLRGLLRLAQRKGIRRVHAAIAPANADLLRQCEHFGFTISRANGVPVAALKDLLPLVPEHP